MRGEHEGDRVKLHDLKGNGDYLWLAEPLDNLGELVQRELPTLQFVQEVVQRDLAHHAAGLEVVEEPGPNPYVSNSQATHTMTRSGQTGVGYLSHLWSSDLGTIAVDVVPEPRWIRKSSMSRYGSLTLSHVNIPAIKGGRSMAMRVAVAVVGGGGGSTGGRRNEKEGRRNSLLLGERRHVGVLKRVHEEVLIEQSDDLLARVTLHEAAHHR
jgi:hypothetical protein